MQAATSFTRCTGFVSERIFWEDFRALSEIAAQRKSGRLGPEDDFSRLRKEVGSQDLHLGSNGGGSFVNFAASGELDDKRADFREEVGRDIHLFEEQLDFVETTGDTKGVLQFRVGGIGKWLLI